MNTKYLAIGLFACLGLTNLQANNQRFVTIIGPDGFPMVVPYLEENKKSERVATSDNKSAKVQTQQTVKNPPVEIKPIETAAPSKQVSSYVSNTNASTQVTDGAHIEVLNPPKSEPYTMINGEKYYDSEYLESKEFNLEDKNRFYQIPMSGSGGSNWNVIERNKGVDMSWFNLRDQQRQQQNSTVVLGKDYQVISQELLQSALPVSCMPEKVLKKAKDFKNQSVSFWPRAPLKDDFDFELLALKDKRIQNFKLTSFAKSDQIKEYYWPMVVFLDHKGCVVEGAVGYFTQSYTATMLQTDAVEGVLHLPENTHYVLFTPLESAVDLPEHKLSNQGQITLTILR